MMTVHFGGGDNGRIAIRFPVANRIERFRNAVGVIEHQYVHGTRCLFAHVEQQADVVRVFQVRFMGESLAARRPDVVDDALARVLLPRPVKGVACHA